MGTEQQFLLLNVVPVVVVLVFGMLAAATDIRESRIENVLTIPLMLTGIFYHFAVGVFGLSLWQHGGVVDSLFGAAFGFGVLLIPWQMGGVDAGDVKLMTGVGAWLGLELSVWVFIASALIQGLYALALVYHDSSSNQTWMRFKLIWLRIKIFGRYLGSEDSVESDHLQDRSREISFGAMLILGLGVAAIGAWLFPDIASRTILP